MSLDVCYVVSLLHFFRYTMFLITGSGLLFLLARFSSDDEDKIVTNVQRHYRQAEVDGCIYDLGDCATIKVTTLLCGYFG